MLIIDKHDVALAIVELINKHKITTLVLGAKNRYVKLLYKKHLQLASEKYGTSSSLILWLVLCDHPSLIQKTWLEEQDSNHFGKTSWSFMQHYVSPWRESHFKQANFLFFYHMVSFQQPLSSYIWLKKYLCWHVKPESMTCRNLINEVTHAHFSWSLDTRSTVPFFFAKSKSLVMPPYKHKISFWPIVFS